jgi:hypothetical protein
LALANASEVLVTKSQRAILGRYIRHVANELHLRDWTFHVKHEPAEDPDVLAEIRCTFGTHEANIWFCKDFVDREPEQQRETVVHELVHPHVEIPWEMVRDDLKRHLGMLTWDTFTDAYKRNMEFGVDALAKSLAPHLPLIDWDKG